MTLVKFVNDSEPYLSAENLNNNFEELDNNTKKLEKQIKIDYTASEEIETNEYINGERVYTRRYSTNEAMSGSATIKIPLGMTNYDQIWIDMGNSYYINTEKRSLPIVATYYTDTSSNVFISAIIVDNNILLMGSGWNTSWTKVVVVKYTKK